MVNCEECHGYAKKIYERGEIGATDINKLALDRHILKGCKELLKNEIRKTEDHLIDLREMLNS